MNSFILPAKSVVYVMDAYCGWCWGVSARVAEFASACGHRVAFAAISGGLFVGARAKPLAGYPHIPHANALIAQQTGAVFGSAYKQLLRRGEMVMDSHDAGAALAALRSQAPDRALHWAHQLQHAFYVQGRSLSDAATAADIASAEGLDPQQVLRDLESGAAHRQAQADFDLAREFGVSSYPTLLYADGKQIHRLPGTGATIAALNQHLDMLLA